MIREKAVNAVYLYRNEGWRGVTRVSRYYLDEWKKSTFFIRQSRPFHLISQREHNRQIRDGKRYSFKFSILTPLYNTSEIFLKDLYTSLKKQTYDNWELCLADASDEKHAYVGDICRRWQKKDSRIRYKKLDHNGGISDNTNQCFLLATGDYIGLLDHDDILHESALYYMAKYIDASNADVLYSDEAKFKGKIKDTTDFVFKNGFGVDELRSHNYFCHFTVFRRALIQEGELPLRSEFDGSQDHDLVLRLTERASKVIHIPKVLYYWRLHNASVSMNLDSKPYAVNSAIRAVEEQLRRQKENGTVASNLPYRTAYRIRYDVDCSKKVLIIICGFHSEDEFLQCQSGLLRGTDYQNTIIDGIAEDEKHCFAKVCNQMIESSGADYVVLWHVKCMPKAPDWLTEMLMHAQREKVLCVGPKVLYSDRTVCTAGLAFCKEEKNDLYYLFEGQSDDEQGYEAALRYVRNVTALWSGCCMFERRKFMRLGGFSEQLRGYELADFCLRGRASNLRCIWTCFAVVEFLGIKSERDMTEPDQIAFEQKWGEVLKRRDPYLHPVLQMLKLV